MILLLNLELVTGSFAIIPIANFRKKVTTSSMFRNLSWAFFGNLLGSIFYALLFAISVSKFGSSMDSPLIEKIIDEAKRAKETLETASSKLLGAVINDLDKKTSHGYHYYYAT